MSGRPSGKYRRYPNDCTARPSLTAMTPISLFLSMVEALNDLLEQTMPGLLAFLGVELYAHCLVALNNGRKRGAEVCRTHLEFLRPFVAEGMVEIVGFTLRVLE